MKGTAVMGRTLRLTAIMAMTLAPRQAAAQIEYGSKGIYPVYESGEQWLIFDKTPLNAGGPRKDARLAPGERFLLVGSRGSGVFTVARSSGTYGGGCRKGKPVRLAAALLSGPRGAVGTPIIGIHVKPSFSLKGSRAVFQALRNEVSEEDYRRLGPALQAAAVADIKSGSFRFGLDDEIDPAFIAEPPPEKIQTKIDFGARAGPRGLAEAFFFVEGTQILGTYRRCLRLSSGERLVGECAEMPHALMAETGLLEFVAYDPSGRGRPFVLAHTPAQPLWGHERWGLALDRGGPRLFLMDAMDVRCREGF